MGCLLLIMAFMLFPSHPIMAFILLVIALCRNDG